MSIIPFLAALHSGDCSIEVVRISGIHMVRFLGTRKRGVCIRTRRIYSTLHNEYNLRRFPFDRQHLQLVFSDADYDSREVVYDGRPQTAGIAEEARRSLSSWKIEGDLTFARDVRRFAWEESAPNYDYATFGFQIRRHVTVRRRSPCSEC